MLCDIYGGAIGKPRDARDGRLANCDAGDRWWYEKELEALKSKYAE